MAVSDVPIFNCTKTRPLSVYHTSGVLPCLAGSSHANCSTKRKCATPAHFHESAAGRNTIHPFLSRHPTHHVTEWQSEKQGGAQLTKHYRHCCEVLCLAVGAACCCLVSLQSPKLRRCSHGEGKQSWIECQFGDCDWLVTCLLCCGCWAVEVMGLCLGLLVLDIVQCVYSSPLRAECQCYQKDKRLSNGNARLQPTVSFAGPLHTM